MSLQYKCQLQFKNMWISKHTNHHSFGACRSATATNVATRQHYKSNLCKKANADWPECVCDVRAVAGQRIHRGIVSCVKVHVVVDQPCADADAIRVVLARGNSRKTMRRTESEMIWWVHLGSWRVQHQYSRGKRMNLRQRTAEHRTAVRKTLADESINLKVWLNFRVYCIRERPIYRILVQINWRAITTNMTSNT